MLETNEIIVLVSLAALGVWYFAGCPGAMSLIKIFASVLNLGDNTIKASENKDLNPLMRMLAKLAVFIIGGALILLYIFRRSLPRLL